MIYKPNNASQANLKQEQVSRRATNMTLLIF